jgi:hypothetical protein
LARLDPRQLIEDLLQDALNAIDLGGGAVILGGEGIHRFHHLRLKLRWLALGRQRSLVTRKKFWLGFVVVEALDTNCYVLDN